jgi:hypothetical protein
LGACPCRHAHPSDRLAWLARRCNMRAAC